MSPVLPVVANKASFADAALDIVNESRSTSVPACDVVVGGALLHRLPWPRGEIFETTCEMSVDYVLHGSME